ncbi:MAG: ATP-binding protein [Gemmatimonadales bacterium]|jgi:two-component system sensor histidine kinase PilS (NtrC family)
MRWLSAWSGPDLSGGIPSPWGLLQWVYVGRVTVAIVVFVAAAVYLKYLPPETIVILAVAALASVIVSTLSFWHTHIRNREPGLTFLYGQALFDLGLVTTVVHVTEGPESQFPALYILVIGVSAVLMPFASSSLVTALASLLYVADIVFFQSVELSGAVFMQLGVFVAVFVSSGLIASRVRVVGVEREELKQEVQRLKLEASDILRAIQSGVITVDGDGIVVYANPAATRLLGLGDRDLVGESLKRAIGDRTPGLVLAVASTQLNRQRSLRSEAEVLADEQSFPIGITTTSIETDQPGTPSVTAIFTDISDQKRVEELHLRTERLEAVAELSASLAHEIKNPLASIRSSIEQIAGVARANEEERFLGQLVIQESDRLSRLLTEFLDFSRVQVTHPRPIDLRHVAESAVEVVRKHPDCDGGAAIDVQGAPAQVEGDEDLLHRVVVNLVLNAVQASPDTARVTVEVREVSVDEIPAGVPLDRAVLLRVADAGPGIPLELRDRLFDPFVSGRVGGSGLGLAIVQRAVLAHRGVVLVESSPKRGTEFRVFLPVKPSAEAAA